VKIAGRFADGSVKVSGYLKREGLLKTVPGFHPAGALRATKFFPDKFVKPSSDAPRREGPNPGASSETGNPAKAGFSVSGGEGVGL
jgi:hypothetical protein